MQLFLAICRTIEEVARRALFTMLMRLSNRAWRAEPDAIRDRPQRVLFIMEDALGDMILTLPAIRAIAMSHPDTVVDVVTWPGAAELLVSSPFVRRTILFPRYDRRRWYAARKIARAGPYDTIVDGMVLTGHVRSRNFAMMLASRARYWVGEAGRGNDYLLNVPLPRQAPPTPHLNRMLGLAAPFVVGPPELRPRLYRSAAEDQEALKTWGDSSRTPRILVNVSTNGSERQWPHSRFAEVAQHLRRRAPAARIIVVGLERDRATIERVARAGDGEAQLPTIRSLMALVATADLVVSPDTSVCHMASAFERTLVSIHNAGKESWHPFDTPGFRVIGDSELTLENVSTGEVLRAVDVTLYSVVAGLAATSAALPII
jgi:ADP-heptose:LPS heptosyltransferase